MRVLFLALGTTRVPTVIEEANEVIARDGSAVVLVDTISTAHFQRFHPKVRVVRIPEIVQTVPTTMTWWLLFHGPQLATYAAARGRLRRKVRRVHHAYARRVAGLARRGRFKTIPEPGNRVYDDVFDHVLWHTVLHGQTFDLMVVGDPISLPTAARLMRANHRAPTAKKVSFTVDAVPH
jgi:hypothetical protein